MSHLVAMRNATPRPGCLKTLTICLLLWAGQLAGNSLAADAPVGRGERPPVDFASLSGSGYEPGRVYVRFTPIAEQAIKESGLDRDKNGLVVTGLEGFDQLGQKHGISEGRSFLDALYSASPASLQFQERHREWGFHLWYEFDVPAKTDVLGLVESLNGLQEVELAEPVLRIRQIEPVDFALLDAAGDADARSPGDADKLAGWIPNDPFFANHQWHLNNTGQTIGGVAGTAGADIGAPIAWGISTGSPAVIVAVIDDGVHVSHPDLAANIWSGVGYNFVDGNTTITPDGSHGTHVSGTIAAVTNNGAGVAGIAGGSGSGNGARIMTCQIFTASGSGNAHLAMIYAADNGAAISQNSWGYDQPNVYNQSLLDAIDYFNAHGGGTALAGGITVFAAGNDNSEQNWYPAFYSGAIAVAATNNQDMKASYSNYGSWIDISAPGSWIASTTGSSGYGAMSGTSAACPNVSGVAALLASYAPGSSASQVISILLNNTDNHYPVNPGYAGKLGSGRLSAAKALSQISGAPMPVTVSNPSAFSATAVSSSRIDISWMKNASGHNVMLAYSGNGSFGSPSDGTQYNAGANIPGGGTVIYRGSANAFSMTGLEPGTVYYFRAWSYNADNVYSSGISTQATTSQPDTHFIVATAGENGSIEPSGTISVQHGGGMTFQITPGPYHSIGSVVVNGSNVGPVSSYTFSDVKSNQVISAEFTPETYIIHATAGPNGRISPSGPVAVARGSSMSFDMVADAGHVIKDVLVNGASVGTPSSYTFENVTGNQTISVQFARITHTILATAGENGNILPTGSITVYQGADQTFEIMADTGFHISEVLVDGESAGLLEVYTFKNIQSDHSIAASFEQTFFTILSSSGPNGSIDPSGELSIPYGQEVAFYFTPEPGYEIFQVLIDGETVGQPEFFVFSEVTDNHTIAVEFTPVIYAITATAGEGGSIEPLGVFDITVEDEMDFLISPDEGYLLLDVILDGESIGPVESYSFSEVTSNRTIHAEFEEIIPEVTHPVTFQVDMQFFETYNPDRDVVYISGSMFDWAEPGSLPEARMFPDGKSAHILKLMVELPEGAYTYKYYLNEGTMGEEWPGEPLRNLEIPEMDFTYDYFGYMTDPTNIHLPGSQDALSVFPNPARDRLFVESSGTIRSIQLIDITGRQLLSASPSLDSYSLHTGDLPEGMYIIRVVLDNMVITRQVILQR